MNVPNVNFKKEDLIITNIDNNEMQLLHEAKNPQNLIKSLNGLNKNANIDVVPIQQQQNIELQNKIESIMANDNSIEDDDWDDSDLPFDPSDEPINITNIENNNNQTTTIIKQENDEVEVKNINAYPKTFYITKEDFKKFVKSLSILKNFKQNVVFENGATHFISDTSVYVCRFNTNIKSINLRIPYVDQQSNQLSFLTKSKNAITIVETEDDYIFNDGQFKFQLRKNLADLNILTENKFNAILNTKSDSTVLIAQYEFTDKNHLDNFLSILKGVKRPNIEFKTSEDNTELILERGDINSGKFELLRIPCNVECLEGRKIDSLLDSVCLLYDYKTLKFEFYYDGKESDSLHVVIKGTIGEDYDVIFICKAYRDYTTRTILI